MRFNAVTSSACMAARQASSCHLAPPIRCSMPQTHAIGLPALGAALLLLAALLASLYALQLALQVLQLAPHHGTPLIICQLLLLLLRGCWL